MTASDWIAICALVVTASGTVWGFVNSSIDKKIDRKILEYNKKIQDDKILQLVDENNRLRDRVNQTK